MENASKALLIAGEVLIAMLVASMMVLLFSTMSSYADEHAEQRRLQEVEAFNANVLQYAKAKECTAQDIVSLVNFAREVNEKRGCTGTSDANHATEHMCIKVSVTGIFNYSNMEDFSDNDLRDFLQNGKQVDTSTDTGFRYYKATINRYSDDGRIQTITFSL